MSEESEMSDSIVKNSLKQWILKIVEGPLEGAVMSLPNGGNYSIGRGNDVDLLIPDDSLDERAAVISPTAHAASVVRPDLSVNWASQSDNRFKLGENTYELSPSSGDWSDIPERLPSVASPDSQSARFLTYAQDSLHGSDQDVGSGNDAGETSYSKSVGGSGSYDDGNNFTDVLERDFSVGTAMFDMAEMLRDPENSDLRDDVNEKIASTEIGSLADTLKETLKGHASEKDIESFIAGVLGEIEPYDKGSEDWEKWSEAAEEFSRSVGRFTEYFDGPKRGGSGGGTYIDGIRVVGEGSSQNTLNYLIQKDDNVQEAEEKADSALSDDEKREIVDRVSSVRENGGYKKIPEIIESGLGGKIPDDDVNSVVMSAFGYVEPYDKGSEDWEKWSEAAEEFSRSVGRFTEYFGVSGSVVGELSSDGGNGITGGGGSSGGGGVPPGDVPPSSGNNPNSNGDEGNGDDSSESANKLKSELEQLANAFGKLKELIKGGIFQGVNAFAKDPQKAWDKSVVGLSRAIFGNTAMTRQLAGVFQGPLGPAKAIYALGQMGVKYYERSMREYVKNTEAQQKLGYIIRGAGMSFSESAKAVVGGTYSGVSAHDVIAQKAQFAMQMANAEWGESQLINSLGRHGIQTFNSDGTAKSEHELLMEVSRVLKENAGNRNAQLRILGAFGQSPDKLEYYLNYEDNANRNKSTDVETFGDKLDKSNLGAEGSDKDFDAFHKRISSLSEANRMDNVRKYGFWGQVWNGIWHLSDGADAIYDANTLAEESQALKKARESNDDEAMKNALSPDKMWARGNENLHGKNSLSQIVFEAAHKKNPYALIDELDEEQSNMTLDAIKEVKRLTGKDLDVKDLWEMKVDAKTFKEEGGGFDALVNAMVRSVNKDYDPDELRKAANGDKSSIDLTEMTEDQYEAAIQKAYDEAPDDLDASEKLKWAEKKVALDHKDQDSAKEWLKGEKIDVESDGKGDEDVQNTDNDGSDVAEERSYDGGEQISEELKQDEFDRHPLDSSESLVPDGDVGEGETSPDVNGEDADRRPLDSSESLVPDGDGIEGETLTSLEADQNDSHNVEDSDGLNPGLVKKFGILGTVVDNIRSAFVGDGESELVSSKNDRIADDYAVAKMKSVTDAADIAAKSGMENGGSVQGMQLVSAMNQNSSASTSGDGSGGSIGDIKVDVHLDGTEIHLEPGQEMAANSAMKEYQTLITDAVAGGIYNAIEKNGVIG